MKPEEERNKILQEREAIYGSFKENMQLLMKIEPNIEIITTKEKEVAIFIKNILALKAARSIQILRLNSNSEAYKDCINDFKNYIQLFYDYDPQGRIILHKFFEKDSNTDILNFVAFQEYLNTQE